MKLGAVKGTVPPAQGRAKWKFKKETLFTLLMAAIALGAFLNALTFPFGSGLYPMVIALIAFGLAVSQVIVELRQKVLVKEAMDIKVEESQKGKAAMKRALKFLVWFGGLFAGIYVLGYQIIMLPWLVAFMLVEGHIKRWRVAIIAAIAAVLILWLMPDVLQMTPPSGLLQDWLRR